MNKWMLLMMFNNLTISSKHPLALLLCLGLCSCSTIQAPYKKVKVWNERRVIRSAQESEDAPKIYDGEVEPRMPSNWDNDSTLVGIDANNNGVRDDVEIWINRRWASPTMRKGLKQLAAGIQRIILSSDLSDAELKDVYTNTYSKAMRCVLQITRKMPTKDAWEEIDETEEFVVYSSWRRAWNWDKNVTRSLENGAKLFNDHSVDACLF